MKEGGFNLERLEMTVYSFLFFVGFFFNFSSSRENKNEGSLNL